MVHQVQETTVASLRDKAGHDSQTREPLWTSLLTH